MYVWSVVRNAFYDGGEGRTMSVMKKEAEDPTSGADLEVDLAHPGRS